MSKQVTMIHGKQPLQPDWESAQFCIAWGGMQLWCVTLWLKRVRSKPIGGSPCGCVHSFYPLCHMEECMNIVHCCAVWIMWIMWGVMKCTKRWGAEIALFLGQSEAYIPAMFQKVSQSIWHEVDQLGYRTSTRSWKGTESCIGASCGVSDAK